MTVHSIAPEPYGAHEPVALGAPLRYDEIKARGLNPNESFGIAAIEQYNDQLHPDASPNGSNPTRRVRSQYYEGYDVRERWWPMLKQNDFASRHQKYAESKWQMFVQPVEAVRSQEAKIET